jgi:hypothetical protein
METLHHPVSPGISPIDDDTDQEESENSGTLLTQTHTSIPHRADAEREDIVIFRGRSEALRVSNTDL